VRQCANFLKSEKFRTECTIILTESREKYEKNQEAAWESSRTRKHEERRREKYLLQTNMNKDIYKLKED